MEDYKERKWRVYEVAANDEDHPHYDDGKGITVYGFESEGAKEFIQNNGRHPDYYYDWIQEIEIGFDKTYGCDYGKLIEEWRGHPIGTMIFWFFKGLTKKLAGENIYTYAVEV